MILYPVYVLDFRFKVSEVEVGIERLAEYAVKYLARLVKRAELRGDLFFISLCTCVQVH